jgi:hypothetical protein
MSRAALLAAPFACALALAAAGCTPSSSGGDTPASSSSASSKPSAPRASASAVAPKPPAPVVWSGSYASKPGSLYVYDGGEWKGFHFRGDDASIGLGEGKLSLTIDPKDPALHGTGTGPLGDVILTGASDAKTGEVTFTLLRKDTTDRGFTGTGVGHITGKTLTGTMRLSRGDAHVIRDATFSLAPAP